MCIRIRFLVKLFDSEVQLINIVFFCHFVILKWKTYDSLFFHSKNWDTPDFAYEIRNRVISAAGFILLLSKFSPTTVRYIRNIGLFKVDAHTVTILVQKQNAILSDKFAWLGNLLMYSWHSNTFFFKFFLFFIMPSGVERLFINTYK